MVKQCIKRIVYSLIYLLIYAHTNTNGMLKKQFEKLDKIMKIDGSIYQTKTPPSPVSPISSPGSYTPPSSLMPQKKKLNNSSITTRPATTKESFLRTMFDYYTSVKTETKKPLTINDELGIYHNCIDLFVDEENRSFLCKDFLEYIKKQNIALVNQNKKTLPRVIAWASLDSFLTDKNISLEDIVNDKKGLLEKLTDQLGSYTFPAGYINNQTNKLQSKKNSSIDTLFLSPNQKLLATVSNNVYMQDILHPHNRQKLTVKKPKYSTEKIGDAVVFEPAGKFAVIYSTRGPITLWDITNTGICIATIYDKSNEKRLIKSVLVSNSCQRILILFSDGSYLLRSVDSDNKKNGLAIKTVTKGNAIQQAILSPDGKLLATDTIDGTLWVRDFSKKSVPDNKLLFPSCTTDNAIYSYLHPDKKISQLAFDPLSKYIAIVTEATDQTSNTHPYHLIFCDLTKEDNNQPILDWPLPESVSTMAFSTKGRYLALGYKNGFINICPVGKKETNPLQLSLTFGSITELTFDSDETSLFASTTDGSVIILDVQSGEITALLKHKHSVVNGYFTSRWPLHGILTSTNNKSIYRWGAKTFDVSIPTYLILRYLPPHQVLSLNNPETAVKNGAWIADKTNIKNINADLGKFGCALVSVLVVKSEIIREKTDEKSSELVTIKKPKQLLWLSDQESRFFLTPEGEFPTTIGKSKTEEEKPAIFIDQNWFDPEGKNSIS